MGVIKGVLKEELENSLSMLKRYQKETDKIKGCLVKKKIGNKYYYYLVRREGKKVKFVYKGPVSGQISASYKKQRKTLERYKKLILQTKKQIKFLRKVLNAKESV